MNEPTLHEIARRQDEVTAAMNRLSSSLDKMSVRIEALPDTIDRTYVRKDVDRERNARMDRTMETLTANLQRQATNTQEQFDKLTTTIRWVVAAVLIPIALAIFALLNARAGAK